MFWRAVESEVSFVGAWCMDRYSLFFLFLFSLCHSHRRKVESSRASHYLSAMILYSTTHYRKRSTASCQHLTKGGMKLKMVIIFL